MRKLAMTTMLVATLVAVPVAATAGDTTVSFTVAANSSAISMGQTATTATLTDGGSAPAYSASDTTVTGDLPTTTVTDQRGVLLGAWTISVSASDFVQTADGSITVDAANARAYLPSNDLTSLATLLGGGLNGMVLTGAEMNGGTSDLGTPYTLLSGTTTTGNGSVTYTPKMDTTIPGGTPVGTYTTTVVQTAS